MADVQGNGEVLRSRLGTAERELHDLADRNLSMTERLARVEARLDDVVLWLKLEAGLVGGLVVGLVSTIVGYLLMRGH